MTILQCQRSGRLLAGEKAAVANETGDHRGLDGNHMPARVALEYHFIG